MYCVEKLNYATLFIIWITARTNPNLLLKVVPLIIVSVTILVMVIINETVVQKASDHYKFIISNNYLKDLGTYTVELTLNRKRYNSVYRS